MIEASPGTDSAASTIRPFPALKYSDADLADLRRRITATRWPTRELVQDDSQGVQLAMVQALAQYWGTDYDWRKCEAKLNAIPQFLTEIEGQEIHFIHVRSKHDSALPLIVTHGWPGSVIEQLKIIEPLTNPTAHGASASDAFHIVIPSMPGHGFSPEPTVLGWDPVRIAKAWVVLMERLGYDRFVAQGGDWGANVTQELALLAPTKVLAINTNMPGTVPADILAAAKSGAKSPVALSGDELQAFEQLSDFYAKHLGYAVEMTNRPQTLYVMKSGYGYTWFVTNQAIVKREFALSGSEQNPDLTNKDWRLVLGRATGKQATPPVEAFKRYGADFVVRDSLEELVAGMNELTPEPILESATVRHEVTARDRELANPYGKDLQIAAIRQARNYLGDRLIRTVQPHRLLDPDYGPLIGVKLNVLTRKTLGGLETDLQSRVFGPNGAIVPGLYAAGGAAGFGGGGVHGYRALEGTFLGGCIFSGRAAGRAAAAAC